MADIAIEAPPADLIGVDYVLMTIGFDGAVDRANIMEAGLGDFEDFRYLVEKDIRDMADEFGKRTVANGRIVFGLGRTKKLTGVMHWVQDCYRVNDIPLHDHFDIETMYQSLSLAQIRKADIDLVATNTKAADPGKFKDERKWPEWEKAFINYLAVIPGVSGIPLSYVVRESEDPDAGADYGSFNERMIHRAPLIGQYYIADARRVHTLLLGFLQGENTESWIRSIARYQDGRRDMIALRRHYAGEGNSTRRIADAKKIQATLHYKTERALPFNKFLDSLQRMFTIFEEEHEPLSERAKVDELLSKVQNSGLSAAVAHLRYQLNTSGVTFTIAANHLNSEVSQTPDYQLSRRINATNTTGRGSGRGGRGDGRGHQGRHNGRGRGGRGGRGTNNKTTYYSAAEWEKLSFEERDRIRKERDKKGEPGGSNGSKRSIAEMTTKQLTTAIISSIKAAGNNTEHSDEDKAETPKKSNTNAGNSFGGRRACDVLPYNAGAYEAERDIPIVGGATAFTCQITGETFILIINEGLYFGDKLEHSLLNPNQLRYSGVVVADNPFNQAEPLSISTPDLDIPLQISGTTIFLESVTPTQRELDTCTHIHLTCDAEWNPQTVHLSVVQSVEAEEAIGVEPFLSQISSIYCCKELAEALNEVRVIKATQVDVPASRTFVSKERHPQVNYETLSERWNIGLTQAKQTLNVTTQKGVRSAILPLSRRYRTDRMYYQRKLRNQRFYTDTIFGKCKSLTNNTCAQIFANEAYFVKAYPMEKKSGAGLALRQFIRDFGVPEYLTSDGASEQTGPKTEFIKNVRKHGIEHHVSETKQHQQNRAEAVIREVKKRWFRQMMKRRVPKRLWDYGIVWVCETMSLTANSSFALEGRAPIEQITGETPDISEYLDFGFYDWVWYKDNAGVGENMCGRWLGVSHRVGNLMSYWILTPACRVISRTTVQRITNLELATNEVKDRCKDYNERIKELMHDDNHVIQDEGERQLQDWDDYTDNQDEGFEEEYNKVVSDNEIPEADHTFTPDTFEDTYLNKEVALARGAGDGEDVQFGRVTKRLRDADGLPIGTAHENPLLDTREYDVEFMDGHSESLSANLIAQNLYSQIDEEGARHVLLDDIVDHRRTETAIDKEDAFITMSNGVKRRKQTTQGWQLLCQWRDGSTTWVALKDMKQSYPIQVAEYAVANRINEEPAFAWWVATFLKKRDRILAKVKSKYWQRTHKYGIRIPKTVEEALAIDKSNGNTLWWDAICKEMKNVRPAFEQWEKKEGDLPPGYQKIRCHFIFDIKMGENFRRKARLVADGSRTETPSALTYSSVVSRDSVRIALLIASLNDLQLLACDIQNAYLTADCREKVYIVAGPEFGSEAGTLMVVKKALYGLKSSGAAFRAHLAETLHDLNYKPSKGDPDVWIRPATKPDGFEYYEMVLVYVDDILCISHDPKSTMKGIQATFKLKDDRIEKPENYLGAQLMTKIIDGVECWAMTSEQYIKAAIAHVESKLAESGQRLPTRCTTPMQANYRPELDTTAELKIEGVRYYQELVGILRWAVELGRIDIAMEISMLSTHLALPRSGHLQQVYHMFGYLKAKPKRTLVFDPAHPDIDESRFVKCDWHDFYRDAQESIPGDAPEPRGNVVSTHCFVDADHAGNRVTRRSQTGILIFVNRAPILWYSKRQNTVETSTFGSEFVAMKVSVELIEALRYKLRMFGIPIEGPTNVFCDNEAVTKNTIHPESTLKKKHNAIAYHRAREAVAAGTIRVTKEDGKTNLADVLTKPLPQVTREYLCDKFMY